RLHRAPEIPADVPAEWADLIRSMTATEPLVRPSAADVESVLRQALVSSVSAPGELAPEITRVLPAMPFRPPSIAITAESELPGGHPNLTKPGHTSVSGVRGQIPGLSRLRHRGRRFWTAAVLALLAAGAAATALTFSLAPQPSADVVPYPAVSGTLGDHLQELQKSVEP
ncbi:MAG TPA: serine/threonine protein kinase, partial [Arthrobacter sp.]